ncbi:lipoate--protein ligase family protein [Lentibacillus sp. Marseille-P4043]|uniref:lipoate--protein ligase family protein n=1 Tax=Lentibacillus sp. Marseille-P4043 TaxID=2040293 RepID=UPI000D0B498D|nr:biotin/lipoate A/B protein ligase family protein [Lentibacillus sp. Marseille-P4043]
MRDEWGFIDTGICDAAVNMALDEMLLQWHSEGKIPPILRFYQWSTPSLSLGYFQDVDKAIELEALDRYQIPLVRRLTGGSAVLHDDELTYSIIIAEDKPYIPASVGEAYYILSKGIFAGYTKLGITANYAETNKTDKSRSAVCFEKPALYELMAGGKKISGNAQTRQKGILLQHGSIPRSIDKTMLFDLFCFPSEEIRERKRKAFGQKATTINQETKQHVSMDTMKNAFKTGFETGVDIGLFPFELTTEQWNEVYQLAEAKYSNNDWNFKHNLRSVY